MSWNNCKRFGLFLICLPAALPAAAQSDTLFLPVERLFELGVRHNLALQADALEERSALERERGARAERLPDLQVGLRGGYAGRPTVFRLAGAYHPDAPDWSQNYAVDLSQPIYRGGKLRYAVRKAGMERSLAALRTEADAADIRLALLEQYMQLFELYRRQEVFSRNIEESERRLHDIRRMKEEGLITNNDVLRSEMQLTDDRLSLQRTQNDLVLASQHLDILLGLRETLLIRPDTAILHRPIELESYETYVGEAYAGDPDLKRLRMQTELARHDVALARSAIRPDVSLYASNTLARPVARTMEDLYNNNWNVGLSVSVPLFALYKSRHKVRESRLAVALNRNAEEQEDAASPPARAHGLPAPPGGRAGGQGPAALGPAGAGELPHHAEPLHEPTGHPDRSAGREQRAARRRTATDGGTHARRLHLLPTAESLRASLTNRPIWETGTENDRSCANTACATSF